MENYKERLDQTIEMYKNKMITEYADHDSILYGYQDHLSGVLEGLSIAKKLLEEIE